ncbi:MAG: alanine racemase [Clostridia bacterium]|nr:alanine racemase [Clostridia bacterium]
MIHRVKAQVCLNRIAQNYNYIQSLTNGKPVMAVIKADAYGHGAVQVGRKLQEIGCRYFAVATLDEAKELRDSGIDGNILILGPTDKEFIPDIIKNGFLQACDSFAYAKELAQFGKVRIHVKVDSGMSRLGLYCHNKDDIIRVTDEIKEISKLDLSIEGIFTHFADSDGENKDYTQKQFDVFSALLDELKRQGIDVGIRHCCNSAATLRYPEMHLDMVRAGIILYGLMPSANVKDENIGLAMKWSARVCSIHELKAGDCVSYGCTYRAEKDTRAAVISIGYADGFSRVYSGKTTVRINQKECSVIGKICMDMCVVDIGQDFDCKVGDEAIIFENNDDVERLAQTLGTINYEIVCSLKRRAYFEYI